MNVNAHPSWSQVFGFSVLDHVPVGSCVLNSKFEVMFWNKVLEKWTGVDRWDIVNYPIHDFFPNLAQPHYFLRLEQIFKGGPPLVLSSSLHGPLFPSTCADGKPRLQHTTVTAIPTHDGSGCLACFAVEDVSEVTRRITDLKETRDQAEMLAEQARQANQAKSEFLANMSHELRTPLNSILLMSNILVDDQTNSLSEADRNSIQVINNSGETLLELVTDILDFSKTEAGKNELVPEVVDLGCLFRDIVDSTGLLITHKGLNFVLDVGPGVPAKVLVDPQALTRIARNLLSNAAKFTHRGTVTLALNVEQDSKTLGKPCLIMSVTDSGLGIALDRQADIFEPFCQEDGTTSREFGGTGLGLSISRQLSELMGGQLSLKSALGRGSTFTLMIPLVQPSKGLMPPGKKVNFAQTQIPDGAGGSMPRNSRLPAVMASGETMELSPEALAGFRILLADDDMRNLYTLSGILEGAGATVVTARNIQDTVEQLKGPNPLDLVLQGLWTDDLVGSWQQKEIHDLVEARDIALLCISRRRGEEECLGCEGCLAQEVLTKPFPQQELMEKIQQFLPLCV